jgi:hypothetical protein
VLEYASTVMSSSGAVMPDDLGGKLPMLDVACSKCTGAAGSVTGADMRLPDLREILAGECPRVRAASVSIAAASITRSWVRDVLRRQRPETTSSWSHGPRYAIRSPGGWPSMSRFSDRITPSRIQPR